MLIGNNEIVWYPSDIAISVTLLIELGDHHSGTLTILHILLYGPNQLKIIWFPKHSCWASVIGSFLFYCFLLRSTSYHNITLKQVTPRPTQPPIFNEPFFDPAVQLNISIEGEEIDVCGVAASSSEGVSSGLSASTVSSPQAYSESPPLEYPDSPTPLAYPLSSSASSSSSPLYFSQDQDLPLSPRRTPTPAASPTKTQPEKRDQETPFTVKEMVSEESISTSSK